MTVPVVRFTVRGQSISGDAAAAESPGREYTVVYDGHCNVCKKIVARLNQWDTAHRLEILPSYTPGLGVRFPWIPERAYVESIQVIRTSDGHTWQGAAAMEKLLDALPKGKLVTWVFSIPFARPLAEKVYRWFARNRYHLGCGEHCQLRPPDLNYEDESRLTGPGAG